MEVFDDFIKIVAPIYLKLYEIHRTDIELFIDTIDKNFANSRSQVFQALAKNRSFFIETEQLLDQYLYNYYKSGGFDMYNTDHGIRIKGRNEPFNPISCEQFAARFFWAEFSKALSTAYCATFMNWICESASKPGKCQFSFGGWDMAHSYGLHITLNKFTPDNRKLAELEFSFVFNYWNIFMQQPIEVATDFDATSLPIKLLYGGLHEDVILDEIDTALMKIPAFYNYIHRN